MATDDSARLAAVTARREVALMSLSLLLRLPNPHSRGTPALCNTSNRATSRIFANLPSPICTAAVILLHFAFYRCHRPDARAMDKGAC